MAFYWNYNDLSQGTTISSWIDKITSLDMHQGDATKRPTNSTSGLWFNSPAILTNAQTSLPQAQYSIWIVFKPNATTAGFHGLIAGTSGAKGFYDSGATFIYWPRNVTIFAVVAGTSYDLLYNDNGGGGTAMAWTNTVAATTTAGSSAGSVFQFASIGNDTASEPFQGWIKFIGIWTNQLLTAANATNLYNYSQSH